MLDAIRIPSTRSHLERVLALAPGDRACRLGLARSLHALGETPAAVRLLDELLAKRPDDPDALRMRGMVALQSGRAAEAAPDLKRALERAPSDLETLIVDLLTKDGGRPSHGRGQDQPKQQSPSGGCELDPSTKALCQHGIPRLLFDPDRCMEQAPWVPTSINRQQGL